MNLPQNIKWSGRASPLKSHVSNHHQAVNDLRYCANHITVTVPDETQRVEYLITFITCQDAALQTAIGLVLANTNNMKNEFVPAAATVIEVDAYKRSQRGGSSNMNANIAAIDFKAGCGETGVEPRWYLKAEFNKLSKEKRDELIRW